jgi:hypothetical protein
MMTGVSMQFPDQHRIISGRERLENNLPVRSIGRAAG